MVADSSSTSSSEPARNREGAHRHGLPSALLLALALLIGAEWGVRRLDPQGLVVSRDDADQARAVRDDISLAPPIDVAFVGSSMMYQGINLAYLETQLETELAREVALRNVAIRGGRVDVFAATVRHLLRQETKPKLIVVGTSIRDLREFDLDFDRLSLFWTPADWLAVVRESGYRATDHLPTVLRNSIEPHLSLLKYRSGLSTRLQQAFINVELEPRPSLGEAPSQHQGKRRDTVLTMDEFKSRANKERMIQAYRLALPPQPQEKFVRCVDQIIDDCRREGVAVIFIDMPLSEPMRSLIENASKKRKSHRFGPAYLATMTARCAAGGVPFLTAADLGTTWRTDDFYDSQHLNHVGATRMSHVLAPVLARSLRAQPSPALD